jgi:hypothetical protein
VPKPKPATIRAVSCEAVIALFSNARDRLVRSQTSQRSVIPDGRYETKGVAGDCHPADGRER